MSLLLGDRTCSDAERREAYDRDGFAGLRGHNTPDLHSADFRDLFRRYFETDAFGMPTKPYLSYRVYLREYLRRRAAESEAKESPTE